MKKLLVTILLVLFALTGLNANSIIGNVKFVDGRVKVKSEGSLKKSKLFIDSEIKKGDLVTTSKNSKAIIKLIDETVLILDESSTLHLISLNDTAQESGKVYYKVTSRDAKNSLRVKTPFAIIGIKGTTFIIEAGKKDSIKLKEGLVSIESIKDDFELYRKEVQKQFDDFISSEQAAFEEYKQAQRPGFAEITNKFDLQAGKSVSFDNNKAKENSWTRDDDDEFEKFERLMNSFN